MYAKLKTNLIGLAAALSFVVVGFSLGEPPRAERAGQVSVPALVQADGSPALTAQDSSSLDSSSLASRRGALKRHLGMPYVSFAALLPRRES
ncbi:MAG: hypothetical protein K0M73_06760 [Hydrogenophaga sp.]|nr:hypothetical protein [Hydrogenophaga sp.]